MIETCILLLLIAGYRIFKVTKKLSIVTEQYNEQLESNRKILSQKKSSEVRTGQIVEQLAPFTKYFTFDPKLCKFMGQPVDFIYFGEDKIVFIEVKSGNARLSSKQNNIKKLIEENKVEWAEVRISGTNDDSEESNE